MHDGLAAGFGERTGVVLGVGPEGVEPRGHDHRRRQPGQVAAGGEITGSVRSTGGGTEWSANHPMVSQSSSSSQAGSRSACSRVRSRPGLNSTCNAAAVGPSSRSRCSDVRREATACGVTGDDEPTGFRAERARVPQRPACRGVGVDLRRGERLLRGAAVVHRDDRRTTGVREPAAQAVRGEQIPDDEPAAVEVDDQRTVGAASRPVYPDRNPALRPGYHGVVDVADRSPGSGAGDQDSEVVTRLPGGALVQRRPTAALQRAQEQPDAQVGR